ncbi:MBL fold metallo-hydrolase [Myxococcota bacterium]|nr:MBL fold metallo-hydrolase [Myxococcota bacterium]MBU1382943.1 MBL fold metallo-hydrolase [Myxococcota bacterium]MBU1496602.1 MBL fold metallo-hydrolase [Myxococcota bacterium]
MAQYKVNTDLAVIYTDPECTKKMHTLTWGDKVDVIDAESSPIRILATRYEKKSDGSILPQTVPGYIKKPKPKARAVVIPAERSKVLKVNFIDVMQGDAAVIETPSGRVILIDGGVNQLFSRYLATRYRDTSDETPKVIDCIVLTHGDEDHIKGLTEIENSTTNDEPRKRLFIAPRRFYHNGIVKKEKLKGAEAFGKRDKTGRYLTELYDSLLAYPANDLNTHYKPFISALKKWKKRIIKRGFDLEERALHTGITNAFDFLAPENIRIKVLGPFREPADGKEGLRFFTTTRPVEGKEGHNAGKTVNGHSVVLRLEYGAFSCLFTGDLNRVASDYLMKNTEPEDLLSTVMKVPHHGSEDFSMDFLRAVKPLVSVVSCGDEMPDHIHPRANLLSALGRCSRTDDSIILITELAAFLKPEAWAILKKEHDKIIKDPEYKAKRGPFFSFSRAAWGTVKLRTDGKRLLVYTNSGKTDEREEYTYTLNPEKGDKVRRG